MEKWSDGSPAVALGKPVKKYFDFNSSTAIAIPIMEIRAPRGECHIYQSDPVWDNTKSRAIRAFMKEHRHGQKDKK